MVRVNKKVGEESGEVRWCGSAEGERVRKTTKQTSNTGSTPRAKLTSAAI